MKVRAWQEMISYWEFDDLNCDREFELPDEIVKEYRAILIRLAELNTQIMKAYESR